MNSTRPLGEHAHRGSAPFDAEAVGSPAVLGMGRRAASAESFATEQQQWATLEGLRSGGEAHLLASQEAILRSTDAQELQAPFDKGIVSIADLGLGMDYLIEQHTNGWAGDTHQYAQRWVDQLSTRLGDGRTQLLFDPEAGDLARRLIAEGEVSTREMGHSLGRSGCRWRRVRCQRPYDAACTDG